MKGIIMTEDGLFFFQCECLYGPTDGDAIVLCEECLRRVDRDNKITSASITCEYAPFQVEGALTDGRFFYFRARHYSARLHVSTAQDDSLYDPYTACMRLDTPTTGSHPMSAIGLDDGLALLAIMLRLLY